MCFVIMYCFVMLLCVGPVQSQHFLKNKDCCSRQVNHFGCLCPFTSFLCPFVSRIFLLFSRFVLNLTKIFRLAMFL